MLLAAVFSWVAAGVAVAHPGSSILVDARGQVYFVDTGQGVWKLDLQGNLTLINASGYHWMALDETGHFAGSNTLGEFDRGSFERVTPAGAVPALIISSDYPIAIGHEGGLHYVPYNPSGLRELVRRMPDGRRSVFATLPAVTRPKPMMWVNGIVAGPDGALYITDNDAIRKVDRGGAVSTLREGIQAPDCADPLPDTPQLPYLRGLAIAADGTIYAAANGCRAVIALPANGPARTVLKAERPWSPVGVAVARGDVYVLEYLHSAGEDRKEWVPRVRKIAPGGAVTTLATVQRKKN
jgi:hypothetical protein